MNDKLNYTYSSGICDIEYCTQNALFEGGYDMEEHDKIMHFIIKGLKDINIFHAVNKKVTRLEVNEINCINLPEDYVDYLKIGITYTNGLFWTFTKNEAISIYKDFECGEQTQASTSELPDMWCDGIDSDKKITVLFNYTGGNNNQYFRIDKEYNRIHLKNNAIGSEVELEYITTGINTNGDTIIPIMYNDSLVSFALWQMKLRQPKNTPNEIEMSRQEWIRNFSKLTKTLNGFTRTEFLDMIYKHWKQTLKPTA